jgi:acetylglutamate kinase
MIAQKLQPHITKAAVLIEALPYLQAFRGETFLIKMGGSAMDDPELVRKVMRDIVFLEVAGIRPIVVHGGGKAISAAMSAAGLEAQFVGGLRVTTPEAIAIVEKTLSGTINPQLAKMIVDFGGKAVGVPGTEVFVGSTISGRGADGQAVDIGRVGQVTRCRMEEIDRAHAAGIVPVISPLAAEADTGAPLNVNADLAAAALAKQRRVAKLIYLSDVPGLLADPKDPTSLIHSITGPQARDLIADGTISGGMIPKIESALDALENGVRKVHFIDGRVAHTLLLEIFTQSGIGTEIVR